jgi:hypothetical protein
MVSVFRKANVVASVFPIERRAALPALFVMAGLDLA